jgi:hypothetical protein
MSYIEENKTIARRWLELAKRNRVDEMCALAAPTWTMHGGPPGLATGADGVRQLYRTVGPVYEEWTAEYMIAEGDTVVVRATDRCVAESERGRCAQWSLLGRPGHEPRRSTAATFIFRIVGGKVAEVWRDAAYLGRRSS